MLLVPLLEPLLRDPVLLLDALKERADLGERLVGGEVCAFCLVAEGAVMLDVLACGLDGGDAERGGGTLEEVAEGRELREVLLLAMGACAEDGDENPMGGMRGEAPHVE